jgi:hypothetical protein
LVLLKDNDLYYSCIIDDTYLQADSGEFSNFEFSVDGFIFVYTKSRMVQIYYAGLSNARANEFFNEMRLNNQEHYKWRSMVVHDRSFSLPRTSQDLIERL